MATNNNKPTVPPLIIPKSRIQSESNNSPISPKSSEKNFGWITPNNSKRLRSPNQVHQNQQSKKLISHNRFSPLQSQSNDNTNATDMDLVTEDDPVTIPPNKPPPPIYIRGVNDFNTFCSKINEVTKGEKFLCKSSSNGVRLSTSSENSYRNTIKFLQSVKADFHTYQLKQERAFRVVIRNLHPTTPVEDIKNELLLKGHHVRNISNVLQKNTKLALPLFFLDLEPAPNNKEIFKINNLCYTIIKVEEPRFNRQIVQCLRCQGYGHTKSYCNHPPKCVRCGDQHLSTSCQKPSSQPAKCTHCEGDHPANYRGCPIYKAIQSSRQTNKPQANMQMVPPSQLQNVNPNIVNTTSYSNTNPNQSYAKATKNNSNNLITPSNTPTNDISLKLSSFLDDLKSLINPLISLLTSVINKLLNDK